MLEYLVALLLLLATWVWYWSRPDRFPPGPLSLPIIGSLCGIIGDKDITKRMEELHKQYGSIISLCLCGRGIWDVWIRDFDIMKEVLHDPRFSSRTAFSLLEELGHDKGIVFASGETVKVKRKLTLQILRALGVGKSTFSTGIEEETDSLLKYLDRFTNENLYIQGSFAYVTNNIISKLLFNTSYSFDDKSYMEIYRKIMRHFELLNPTQPMFVLPTVIAQFLPSTKELKQLREEYRQFILDNYFKRKPSTNGSSSEAECLSDYLWQNFGDKSEAIPFPEKDIPYILMDLFMAGQETTTTTLSWAILNLLHKPEVQEKIHEELLNEFPERNQIINLNDVTSCNYTMATIHEVQRFTPVSYSAIDHTANVDVENFHGYRIPKGTRMLPLFVLLNKDPQLWKFPSEFNPENFLDENGTFQKSQYLMPFSVGLRSCPGENIAKMELYLVFANLLRRYKICPPSNGEISPLVPKMGFVMATPYYEVQLQKRDK